MPTTVSEWVAFVQSGDSVVGVPLVAAGVAILLLGWRFWRVCLAFSFGAIGYILSTSYLGAGDQAWFYGTVAGVTLGLVSGSMADLSVALLGGTIGAILSRGMFMGFGLHGAAMWLALALAFAIFAALSFINRRKVVMVITSFEGAVLLVAGLAALVSRMPWFSAFFRGTADGSALFLPFILLVPTVIGVLLQAADVRKSEAGN